MFKEIMRYENGEMTDKQTIKFFQKMINSGLCWQLQGNYGRTASELLDAGYCTHAKVGHSDYYGNYIPSAKERRI